MIDKLQYISQPAHDSSHLTAIRQALNAGCRWIQLRIKDQAPEIILEYAVIAKKMCDLYGAKLIIDDHPEVALKVGAYGVHLGLQDMSVSDARNIVGTSMIIGGTANTFQEIQQRAREGVNYIGCGPFRFTETKKNLSPTLGLGGYQSLIKQMNADNIRIPLIAIGGILVSDISEILETGVCGVALSSAITFAHNPKDLVKQIYQLLESSGRNQIDQNLQEKLYVQNSRQNF